MNGVPRKIIITGTGRAGTTFLVRLLTELGLDTGFTRENWQQHVHAHSAAGMEKDLLAPDAPRIVKDPDLCERLPAILAEGRVVVEHALVPVRALEAAAASRVRIGANSPGGLIGTDNAARQSAVLAERFHHLVETLVQYEIPHTFLAFPRFATDATYCYERLGFLIEGVTWPEFEAVFNRVADPKLIHQFKPGEKSADAGAPSRAYRTRQRWKKWPRRVAVALFLVALGLGAGQLRNMIVKTAAEMPPRQGAAFADTSTTLRRADIYTLLHVAFATGDEDANGWMTEEELAWLAAIDPQIERELLQVAGEQALDFERLFRLLDLDHDGRVSEPEFVAKVAPVARFEDEPRPTD